MNKSIFTKGATLTVEPFGDFIVSKKNVDASWDKIREHEAHNPDIFIADHSWEKIKGQTIAGKKQPFNSTIQKLNGNFSNGDILREAELSGFKKIFSWIEAKKIIEQAVLKNQIDGLLHNCVIVYYQFEGDTALYVLSARRHTHGHLEIWAQERELEDGTWVMDDGGVCF
jgi:hypothetical protein